jgi:hypothetical protein
MRIEGTQPNKGISGENAGSAKASPKSGAPSFGAALKKAAAAQSRTIGSPALPDPGSAGTPAAPLPGAQTTQPAAAASKPASPADEAALSPEDHLEMIKLRMKTGYYNSKTLDDALTEKLTGFFDDLT